MKTDYLHGINKLLADLEQELSASTYRSIRTLQNTFSNNPYVTFRDWFSQAVQRGIFYPHGMSVATATAQGKPSVRMILLKGVSSKGFAFITHYISRKGQELDENPQAALLFYWQKLHRQVRIEGSIEKLSDSESDSYFKKRSRQSQIVTWASLESRSIPSRAYLEKEIEKYRRKFADKEIPRPPFWGGYILKPETFEFWQQGEHRFHLRILYTKKAGKWEKKLLAP